MSNYYAQSAVAEELALEMRKNVCLIGLIAWFASYKHGVQLLDDCLYINVELQPNGKVW